ncbi:MAG: 30S ribosomal protein S20 [bacterium]|jgi:small subunit ribosomal protein S20|nr:30S ribosomal protein S20 [Phycisphaeraceae bacterium]
MAHSLSAQKRIRQNEKRNARNRWRKGVMREAIKDLLEKVAHGTIQEVQAQHKKVQQIIDKTAAKGVIHKNQAARRKSRLNARVKVRVLSKAEVAPRKAAKKA